MAWENTKSSAIFRVFHRPIKIVAKVENDTVTVITNYPLRAGAKR